jgi:phenylacetate-CoA ligase
MDRRLNELVAFARRNSPFYRSLYADLPDGPVTLEQLPIIDHGDFWRANTPRDSQILTGSLTDGTVYKTGGTANKPRMSVYTRQELTAVARIWARGLTTAGLKAGDRVANLYYAGELYASFPHNMLALQECLVPVVHLAIGGAAAPEYTAHVLEELSATVAIGPTTTLCRVAEEAAAAGTQFPEVDLILFAGEAFFEDQRAILRAAFPNATLNSCGYASIDGGMLGSPMPDASDPRVHRVFEPHTMLEIVDPETGSPITRPGVAGRVVTTDLVRRLMPVIRYPVGDVAEWVDYSDKRFRLLGRADEGARVGPVTVYLEDVHGLVRACVPGAAVTGLQLVLRRRDAKDELVVRVACNPDDPAASAAKLSRGLDELRPMFADHVRLGAINPLVVEWVDGAGLRTNPRTGKLLPLVDERDTRLAPGSPDLPR